MIIVTGGTHGIGRACVEHLCSRGEAGIFTGRDEATGEALAANRANTWFVRADGGVDADCRTVVARALELGDGKIKGLVNNAGISRRINFADTECADWDMVMNVNARSAFLFTRYALSGLREARGAVVNIASVAAAAEDLTAGAFDMTASDL
jgi:NAD(P)-dependent dehydrogenase (short-subunit alcohol dehydrogenase family)